MAKLDWSVTYGAVLGNTLNDIQSVSLNFGRKWQVDPFNASTCQIVCRNISAWTAAPKMGDEILVNCEPLYPAFYGKITDVEISYGNLTSMDEAVITCEGPLGLVGRRNIRNLVLAQGLTGTQASTILTTVGVTNSSSGAQSTASAQTYTGNALDALNILAATELGRIAENFDGSITFRGRNNYPGSGPTYQTVLAFGGTKIEYDVIEFKSTAENYYTRVTTEPLGLTAQTNNTGSAPYYSYTVNTWDYSNTQANSLSQYLLANFSNTGSFPTSISTHFAMVSGDKSSGTNNAGIIYNLQMGYLIGKRVQILFRGNTYNCICEGYQVSADQNDTRITWYLSPRDTNAYLILDDTVYGTLDSNKLGF